MTPVAWGTLVCRGISLYILVTFLPGWSSFLVWVVTAPETDPQTIANLPLYSTFLVVAVVLWWAGPKLGRHLVGGIDDRDAHGEQADFRQIECLVYSGIGLFLGANALMEAIPFAVAINDSSSPIPVDRLIANGLKLGLGIWLMLLPEGIIGLIHRLRRWPAPPASAKTDSRE